MPNEREKQIDLVRKLTLQQIQVAPFSVLEILKKNGIRTPSKSDLMPAVLVGVKTSKPFRKDLAALLLSSAKHPQSPVSPISPAGGGGKSKGSAMNSELGVFSNWAGGTWSPNWGSPEVGGSSTGTPPATTNPTPTTPTTGKTGTSFDWNAIGGVISGGLALWGTHMNSKTAQTSSSNALQAEQLRLAQLQAQGNLSQDQYNLQLAALQGGGSSSNTTVMLVIGGVALLAVGFGIYALTRK